MPPTTRTPPPEPLDPEEIEYDDDDRDDEILLEAPPGQIPIRHEARYDTVDFARGGPFRPGQNYRKKKE